MKSPVPLTSDHYVHSGITDKTIMIEKIKIALTPIEIREIS